MPSLSDYINALRGPILVTGASGFVGANLYHLIAASRDDVYAIVQSEKNWRLANANSERVLAADLNDSAATKNLIQSILPQTVFDCVAYGAYPFEDDPRLIYQTNFHALVNLVGLLAARPISAYIHAGSSSEYGTNCTAPIEGSPCLPDSHYATSKVAASTYLHFMGTQRQFPCMNLRLYSVYGALEDTSRLMPTLLRSALAGRLPAFVDARTSRDFVHVDDVCAAFVMAAARIHPGLYGGDFNIGSGVKTTIADLASITKTVFGIDEAPRFNAMEGRTWDQAEWYANPNKALETFGWKSQIGLVEGLKTTVTWVAELSAAEFDSITKKNPNQRKRSVSAIVACYKDAEAIPIMHQRLSDTFTRLGVDYEIIFVNDCSPDGSAEIIRSISDTDTRVIGISHSRNFGSQMAFRSGMELATKEGVVLLDGDLQDPPELIAAFHEKWHQGFDVVYGRRVSREMSWFWGKMYKLFYRIFARFSYVQVPLDAGDFSLMDRRVVGWLLNCPERDLFMRGLRAYVGFNQTGVDYIRPARMFGQSTNSILNNLDWAKKGIFSFSNTPLTVLTTVGVVSLAVSTLAAVVVALLRLFVPDIAPRGVTTLLITIIMFGSLNLFALGLIGEYIAKIMFEVKGRPRLIRSALIRNGKTTELLPDGKPRS
jgi:dolichol-phosphate mannosyltransferase